MKDLMAKVDEAFAKHVHRIDRGRDDREIWYFGEHPAMLHTQEAARRIVRACLILGTPITDTLGSDAWLTLLERVADLETAVAELRATAPSSPPGTGGRPNAGTP